MSLIAVDVGSARIGLARSVGSIAVPLDAVPAGEDACETVAAIADELGATEIIIGLPLRLDGSRGPAVIAAEQWAEQLRAHTPVPIRLVDERLTTRQAQRGLHAAGRDARSSRSVIDSASAVVLLQSCLDHE